MHSRDGCWYGLSNLAENNGGKDIDGLVKFDYETLTPHSFGCIVLCVAKIDYRYHYYLLLIQQMPDEGTYYRLGVGIYISAKNRTSTLGLRRKRVTLI